MDWHFFGYIIVFIVLFATCDAVGWQTYDAGRKIIAEQTDGVLARDPATGFFGIVDDAELQAILDTNSDSPKLSRPVKVALEPLQDYAADESMSPVTIMALRKVLAKDGDDSSPQTVDDLSGKNPYDSTINY